MKKRATPPQPSGITAIDRQPIAMSDQGELPRPVTPSPFDQRFNAVYGQNAPTPIVRPNFVDRTNSATVYNDQPTNQQVMRDRLQGKLFVGRNPTGNFGIRDNPDDPDADLSLHRVDPNASYARGGKVNDPISAVIRKLGGGPLGLAAGERSFIPKPPRLGNLGRPMGGGMGMSPVKPFMPHMATPKMPNAAMASPPHVGMIHSVVPGRTDKLPMSVKGGSYIFPADTVSSIGQGNSMAGANALNKLFKMGPYGAATSPIATPKVNYGHMGTMPGALRVAPPRPDTGMAAGGTEGHGEPIPIIAAGGEFCVPPEKVLEIGGGDMKRGHETLDKLVLHIRKKMLKDVRSLKPPKKN